jgi:hypothetical protein
MENSRSANPEPFACMALAERPEWRQQADFSTDALSFFAPWPVNFA